MRNIIKDSVNQSVIVRIVNSTTGIPEQAVEHNTLGAALWYRRDGGVVVPITLVALASADAAHADGGIEHLDDGYYRIDLPDAAVVTGADGADGVLIAGTITDMVVIGAYYPLVSATPSVNVASIANNAITAASIAANAITSDKISDTAVAKIGTVVSVATVTASPSPTTTSFRLTFSVVPLTGLPATGGYNDQLLRFTSGALTGQLRPILTQTAVDSTHLDLTFEEAFTSAPTAGDAVAIHAQHVHPVSQIAAAIDTGTGTGARSVTITVNDGSTVLENAKVRLAQGAESYVTSTNASGVATFSLDDATWNVTITKAGYSFTPTTLVVNGTETQTYSMTAVSIAAPASPLKSTAYIYCYDNEINPEVDVTLEVQQRTGVGTSGYAWSTEVQTGTSDSDGLVSFELARLATYRARRQNGTWVEFTVTNTGTYALPECLGKPA